MAWRPPRSMVPAPPPCSPQPGGALPAYPGSAETDAASPDRTGSLAGAKICSLDDDPDARDVITLTLRHAGAEVQSLASGAELIAVIEQRFADHVSKPIDPVRLVATIKRAIDA